MIQILTYKYRLKGKRAKRQLRRFAWAANQVWNYCVQTQRSIQRAWKFGSTRKWPSIHDRDVNAARNILALGLSAQPPVEESRVAYGR